MEGSPRRLVVLALGGNALLRKGDRGTVEDQWRNVSLVSKKIAELYSRGYSIVVTHGNGPQVGNLLEWFEALKDRIPPLTLDIANAMTQGWIGYMLQREIGNELVARGFGRRVVSLVNQVAVRLSREDLENPTKFVGPYYSRGEAERISRERGWVFREDPRGGWRRVVPSPEPVENVEVDAIRLLVDSGYIVVASGGGGVPVYYSNGYLRGVEAVIDKDLASSILAISLRADRFAILTDVDGVYRNFGKPDEELIDVLRASEAIDMVSRGVFPRGSIAPKVLAAARYTIATGRDSFIGSLDKLELVVDGVSGTRIVY